MDIRFHTPEFFWFLLTLIPLALFYIYLTRRRSSVVPSLQIWRSTKPAEVRFLNRPLKRFLEWLFATFFVLSVTVLAAGIHTASSPAPQQLILLVDNSSSMTRSDDESSESTLLRRSLDKLNQVLRNLPDDTRWRIYQLAPSPRLADRGTGPVTDNHLVQLPAAPLDASGTRLQRFLHSLMKNIDPSDSGVQSYLYSDRQLPNLPSLLQQHSDLQLIPVGGPAGNVAITGASIQRRWNGKPRALHLDLHNYSDSSNSFPLRLHGMDKKNRQITLSAGESKRIRLPLGAETDLPNRLGVVMDTADPFPTDNGAYFRRRTQSSIPVRIDLPSPSARFVRTAIVSAGAPFTVQPGSASSDQRSNEENRDPIQLIERSPDAPPEPGTVSFLSSSIHENLRSPQKPISTNSASTLTKNLDVQELTVQAFSPLNPDADETCLLASGEHCLALIGPADEKRPYVRFGFALPDSNFPLLPEFPVLMHRMLDRLSQNQKNAEAGFSRSDQVLGQTPLTRTWLRPNGGLAQQRINGSEETSPVLPPGWYRVANRNENRTFTPINFFQPDESRMNRTSPTVEQRISASSPPSPSTSDEPFPVRTLVLLIALVTWSGFLVLSIY